MTISCILIDDEPLALAMLEDHCSHIPYLELIGSYTDAIAAMESLKHNRPQLLFLDIQMPDITGIQIAKSVDYNPAIIFTTAFSQYAVDGFELEAVDYLLKPIRFERFQKAVERVQARLGKQEAELGQITIKSSYQNITVNCCDIIYTEALDNYSILHTEEKKYTAHQNLKSLLEALPQNDFVRIHRSFIVNKNKISSYTKSSVNIGKVTLPVGRSYQQDFIAYIQTNNR